MSNLSEDFKSSYKNFKQYARFGTVHAVKRDDGSKVSQNCFYKSVYYIDSVIGPVKDMIVGVNKDADTSTTTLGKREKRVYGTRHNELYAGFANLLLVLHTGTAYLAYLPHKLFSYLREKNGPESLVGYANNFQDKAEKRGDTCAKFLSLVSSYIISVVIWTAALVITPITWTVDKVSSKFSEMKAPKTVEQDQKSFLHNS
ncbi:hypothetical protein [Wolbachia endosymbiont of Mansonella perstans]|uniref:hypothetical protein n=1 Tax=Wolbachia endosymbiont of Mansonella perstans TaxID=229526 RepID=UPI001CE0FDC2|nr:hypothetical protein [Wolbachia endosymbiont of Mansonella perstans]MCA4774475.1 hypothetical protein [Wolbachia endosymbiont of Mansonella perstans]